MASSISGDGESPNEEQLQFDDNTSAAETSQNDDVRLEIEIEELASFPNNGIVSMNSNDTELLLRHRSPHVIPTGDDHVSKHRQEMQRILLDSAANVRYDVPDSKQQQKHHPANPQQPRKQKLESIRWKTILPIPFVSCGARKEYNWSSFQSDVIAGITVAVMAIPLGEFKMLLTYLCCYAAYFVTKILICLSSLFKLTHIFYNIRNVLCRASRVAAVLWLVRKLYSTVGKSFLRWSSS